MIEGEFSPDTVDALRELVERQAGVDVDPCDGHGVLSGVLVGAVPVEDETRRLRPGIAGL
jgi:uncharacterized protein YgfB (UPF0149 family)